MNICECGKSFVYRQGLSRHKKLHCKKKNEISKMAELKMQVKFMQKELYQIKQEQKEWKNERDQLNQIIHNQLHVKDDMLTNAGNIVSKSIGIFEYLATHSIAPALKFKSKEEVIEQLKTEPYEIAQIMISQYRNGKLHEYLGNVLIALYKENESMQQSIWTTDVARLTYLIKSEINTNKFWITDKKGIHAKDIIIMPLLSIVKKEAQKYMKTLSSKKLTQYILDEKVMIADVIKSIGDMRKRSSSELADKINNYIAGHLHIDKNMVLLNE